MWNMENNGRISQKKYNKYIGVSNFPNLLLHDLIQSVNIKPVVN